jgi:hypothetical protein
MWQMMNITTPANGNIKIMEINEVNKMPETD